MFKQLEMSTEMHRQDLLVMSGLEQREFGKVTNQLVKLDFISMSGSRVVPTVRFRIAMSLIDRQVFLKRIGE
jgi:hypothetical protein